MSSKNAFPKNYVIHNLCALRLVSSPLWVLLSSSGEGNSPDKDKGLPPASCDSKQPGGSMNWPTHLWIIHSWFEIPVLFCCVCVFSSCGPICLPF